MQKIFVALEVSVFIDHCNSCHVVTIVYRMKNSSHDSEPFALSNYLIVSLIGSPFVTLILIIISDGKVTHLDHFFVLFTRLMDHKDFSIFFKFLFNFVDYTLNEWLLDFTCNHVIILAENSLNFFSASTPFILLRAIDTHTIDHKVSLNLFTNIFPFI